ncbi:MAG TPA: Fmu (Sun) domain-containing protein [Chitinophagaceae bacterium]|nr:Fmu (Sun) domain-containing protein [Chitinophagaceae bacterium]HRF18153.1 Fmu (Sun) domain-containing protein [Chitinophagaceae bacterium]
MSIVQSHLNSAVAIIEQYRGEEPLASFLRKYFSRHKKYGSKDRKQIAHLCYCYFRLGKALMNIPTNQRILAALFLCSSTPDLLLDALKPEWSDKVLLPVEEKWAIAEGKNGVSNIFPWSELLSAGLDHLQFCKSLLIQPDLFLRIRPGKTEQVQLKLQQAGIIFSRPDATCIALDNRTKIDELIILDKEAVVQDYNSQKVGDFLSLLPVQNKRRVWDCCAASGGKSIMAVDMLGDIKLTVSDLRESILINLRKRFATAGIKEYKSFVSDLSVKRLPESDDKFDIVIADVPCSGSGTWGRTPEQLFYFKEEMVEQYARLQKQIMSNVLHHVSPGGYILYITCSVFKAENEEVVNWYLKQNQLNLIKMELLKGYSFKADTMFAALMQKPL